jgi:hypothetical protein
LAPGDSGPPSEQDRSWLRVLVPGSPAEAGEVACNVTAGGLGATAAFLPLTGASLATIAGLGVLAGVMTVLGAVLGLVKPLGGSPVAPASGAHDLPAGPRRFVGRRWALSRALRSLRYAPGEAPALTIFGMPGVGKTAFALVVARHLRQRAYPDNQLFVDLGKHPEPAAALEAALLSLGMREVEIPRGLEARVRRYAGRSTAPGHWSSWTAPDATSRSSRSGRPKAAP